MDETVLRLEIRGRVQGVGYRASMVAEAHRCGVAGWVRNRSDGTVEAMVAGPADAVGRLVAWARRGPRMAHVAELRVFPGSGRFDGFDAWPTS